jgi:tetratricopeptide (TPR) repeat protein
MIDQGLAFLEKSHNSQLCFPLYQNLVTAAIKLNDYDKAFEIGRKALASYPEHMLVMTQLATIASHQALTGKGFKYFSEGENYGRQALSLLQAGKMPSGYLNNEWNPYKVTLLADLYQSLGIFSLMNTCAEDAAKFLASSTELNPTQPYNYFLLAKAEVQLYRNGVRTPVNSLTSTGKFNSLNEQIVATYAHACVMTEDEKYKPLRKAIDYDIDMLSKVFPNLKSYLAQSIEATKAETNASLTKPAQQ